MLVYYLSTPEQLMLPSGRMSPQVIGGSEGWERGVRRGVVAPIVNQARYPAVPVQVTALEGFLLLPLMDPEVFLLGLCRGQASHDGVCWECRRSATGTRSERRGMTLTTRLLQGQVFGQNPERYR